MDWLTNKETLQQALKKYRYVALIFLVGIVLMLIPPKEESVLPQYSETDIAELTLQESLARLLSKVEGAGKVEVLLTEKIGEEILYQTDDDKSKSEAAADQRTQTVLVEDGNRQKTGLIRQVNPPVYQGAVVLSQGAENPSVRLKLVEAVVAATGLPSHCITVLKMK